MKKRKVLILIIFLFVFILCFVLIINILEYRSNIANGITGDKIKEIKMDMTFEEVISILGKPYEVNYSVGHHSLTCKNPKLESEISVNKNTDIIHIVDSIYNDTNYCCDGYEEAKLRFGKRITLIYTKPVQLSKYYPMLWVHLDSNYRVRNVFAKRHEFMDDICIYSLSWKLDETTIEERQDKVDLRINDELFDKCFKK